MSRADSSSTRRLQLTLRRPRLALYPSVRPTVVIAGIAQPAQWGTGTWQIPADEQVRVGVFLFNRLWRFGVAEHVIQPTEDPVLEYKPPLLPFSKGRFATPR